MEPNYLAIEVLVQQARQQRSQALGELFSAGWNRFMKLFSGSPQALQPGKVVWRILPP
jgi:hypothetical protein